MKRKAFLIVALFVVAVFIFPKADTSAVPTSRPNSLPERDALTLVRAIATMEANILASDGRYGSLDRLLRERYLQNGQYDIVPQDSFSGALKDCKLSVISSADGKHFRISLVSESDCGLALFSDENFKIYRGKLLGCP